MKITVKTGELIAAVSGAQEACADKKTAQKRRLDDVKLSVAGNELLVTGLDGYVAVERTLEGSDCEEGACLVEPSVLVSGLDKTAANTTLTLSGSMLHCQSPKGEFQVQTASVSDYPDTTKFWDNGAHTVQLSVDADDFLRLIQGMKQGKRGDLLFHISPDNSLAPVCVERRAGQYSRAVLFPVNEEA